MLLQEQSQEQHLKQRYLSPQTTILFDDGDLDAYSYCLRQLVPLLSRFLSLELASSKYAHLSSAIWEAALS